MIAELLARTALLILDNFESVIDQATQVGELLVAAPRLRLLVTSRVALRLTGEQEVALAPLQVPDRDARLPSVLQSEAVQLFARRAAAVRYGFSVDESNAEAVARVCRRLDGLPLAIELVAARAGVMSLDELAARLGEVLDLPARAQDVPARQRTLRATLDWSFTQLDSEEQRAFARLAVFPAPFTAPAAAAVLSGGGIPDVLDVLASLVDHSLLGASIDSAETRFSMLQTVRDYARSQLDPSETKDGLARHAAYYQALAVQTGAALRGEGQRRALNALDADIGNIQLAVESLLADGRHEAVADVAWALWLYCWARGALGVWRGWTQAASAAGGSLPVRARARLLGADGFLAVWQQDYDTGLPELQEALQLGREVEDESLVALVDISLVMVYGGLGDEAGARAAGREALRLARAADDRWSEAYALTGLCFLDVALGQFAGREDDFDAMVDAARACEDPVCLAIALGNCGELRLGQRRHCRGDRADRREPPDVWPAHHGVCRIVFPGQCCHAPRLRGRACGRGPRRIRRTGRHAADTGLLVATAGGTSRPAARRRTAPAWTRRIHRGMERRQLPDLPCRRRGSDGGTPGGHRTARTGGS